MYNYQNSMNIPDDLLFFTICTRKKTQFGYVCHIKIMLFSPFFINRPKLTIQQFDVTAGPSASNYQKLGSNEASEKTPTVVRLQNTSNPEPENAADPNPCTIGSLKPNIK